MDDKVVEWKSTVSHAAFCFWVLHLLYVMQHIKIWTVHLLLEQASHQMQLESNSLLYIVFFFHFPLCTPELHMREIWQIEMRTLTKDQQPSAGGCEGHLFVTSDPTSCSCLHPSAPPRSQPSPRSWHCITNFMLHFRFASFPLSIVKGRVDPPESAF